MTGPVWFSAPSPSPAQETFWFGAPVVESMLCMVAPSDREDARRIVRHGLAHVLEQLGEDVGPAPGVAIHTVVFGGGNLYMDPGVAAAVRHGVVS